MTGRRLIARSIQAWTLASEVAWNRSCSDAPVGWTSSAIMSGRSSAAKIAPIRKVSQRPQPTFGPMNPTRTPPAAPSQEVEVFVATEHDRAPSIAQAIVRQMRITRPRVEPALGRRERDPPVHRARISPSGRAGVMRNDGSSYSASAWRSARVRLATSSSASASEPRCRRSPPRGPPGEPVIGRRVERHHRAGDAADAQRGERPDPGWIERRRDDHRGHPPAQPSDRPDERLDERRAAVGLDRGEELHDLEVLATAAVGRQERRPADVDRHPDGAVLLEGLVRDRGRRPDRRLDRRFVAAPGLDPALEVEDDPRIGGLLEVEFLDLDLAVPRGRLPVDPVHAVARRVRPDRRGQRRRLERADRRDVAALELRPPAAASRAAARASGRRRPTRPGRPSPMPRRSRTGRRSGCGAARSGNGRAGRAVPG